MVASLYGLGRVLDSCPPAPSIGALFLSSSLLLLGPQMWLSSSSSLRTHDHATTYPPFSLSLLSSLTVNRSRSPSSFTAVSFLSPSLSAAIAGFLKPTTSHLFSPWSSSRCIHVALSLDLRPSARFHPSSSTSMPLSPTMTLPIFLPSPFSYSWSAPISPHPCRYPALTFLISSFSLLSSPSFTQPAATAMAISDLPCFLPPSVGSPSPP